MKRITFKNSRNQTLVGNLHTSESKSVIILAHGFCGDKSERGRFDVLAESLNKIGYNVLAFDFSGCGESDDDTLTVSKQVDDLRSAIEFVKSIGCEEIGLLGHSLGGLVALKAYSSEITTMVLWSPVTNKVKYTWDQKFSKEQLEELEKKGYLTRPKLNSVRDTILVDKQMLIDRESVDQREVMGNVKCPTLLIQGSEDTSVSVTDSENAMKLLTKDSRLEIINGANHQFTEHMDVIVDLSGEWFLEHLEV